MKITMKKFIYELFIVSSYEFIEYLYLGTLGYNKFFILFVEE